MNRIHLNLFQRNFIDPEDISSLSLFDTSIHLEARVEGLGFPPLNREPPDERIDPENLLGM